MKKYEFSEVFGRGNSKLGDVITFSLPAIDTCPGASELCKSFCYATKGFYTYRNVADKLEQQYKISKRADFCTLAIDLLKKHHTELPVRIHPSGDFYDAEYALKWYAIICALPNKKFWFYTRSWRVLKIYKVLKLFSSLPNVFVWFSVDSETGKPKNIPKHVKLAYVMTDDSDIPRYRPDLYFRDYDLRKTVVKHVKNVMVCPPEQGPNHSVQCDKCRICLSDDYAHRTKDRFTTPNVLEPTRVSLPVLTGV